jgi:hypothetical protein
MRWAGHVALIVLRKCIQMLVGKYEATRPLVQPRLT